MLSNPRMLSRVALLSLMFASLAFAIETGVSPTPTTSSPRSLIAPSKLMAAAVQSANDGIGSGWCGRGVFSILKSMGLGEGLEGGNGQEWERILMKAGWKPVRCIAPQQAPLGSVLVYLGDARMGKSNRGTRGGYFGHVEMVGLARDGRRLYVADSPRANPGGTVRDNFTGRAWLPPGIIRSTPQPVEQQVATIFRERQQMAQEYFSNKRSQFTQLTSPVSGLSADATR